MSADDRVEAVGHGRGLRADHQPGTNPDAFGDCARHRRGRLPRRQADMAYPVDSRAAERAFNEIVSIDCTNTGPDDAQEIVTKLLERTGQWEFLGSDQADKPVTTSNCFRSELTS